MISLADISDIRTDAHPVRCDLFGQRHYHTSPAAARQHHAEARTVAAMLDDLAAADRAAFQYAEAARREVAPHRPLPAWMQARARGYRAV